MQTQVSSLWTRGVIEVVILRRTGRIRRCWERDSCGIWWSGPRSVRGIRWFGSLLLVRCLLRIIGRDRMGRGIRGVDLCMNVGSFWRRWRMCLTSLLSVGYFSSLSPLFAAFVPSVLCVVRCMWLMYRIVMRRLSLYFRVTFWRFPCPLWINFTFLLERIILQKRIKRLSTFPTGIKSTDFTQLTRRILINLFWKWN